MTANLTIGYNDSRTTNNIQAGQFQVPKQTVASKAPLLNFGGKGDLVNPKFEGAALMNKLLSNKDNEATFQPKDGVLPQQPAAKDTVIRTLPGDRKTKFAEKKIEDNEGATTTGAIADAEDVEVAGAIAQAEAPEGDVAGSIAFGTFGALTAAYASTDASTSSSSSSEAMAA